MKRIFSVALSFALVLSLLVGSLAVSAYEWEAGKEPADWVRPASTIDELSATDILKPNNRNATEEAKNLLAYLQYVGNSTEQMVVGAFDQGREDLIWDSITGQFGMSPALFSIHYTVSTETDTLLTLKDVDAVNAIAQEHYKEGAILMLFCDSYEEIISDYIRKQNKEGLDVENACVHFDITNPGRDLGVYALWEGYVNSIVAALKDLEGRGVQSYMFRHFLEFDMRSINGTDGNEESYESFIRVQQQFFDALVDGGLEGFLMTWSPTGNNSGSASVQSRYPGNEYVDVMSVTCYSSSEYEGYLGSSNFHGYDFFCATGKPVGMSELSARTGDWENARFEPRSSWWNVLQSLLSKFPRTAFATAWGNGHYSMVNNSGNELQQENVGIDGNDDGQMFMASPYTITLDDLPQYRTVTVKNPGIAQVFATSDVPGDYVGLEERVYTAGELETMGRDINTIRSIHVTDGYCVNLYTGENTTGGSFGFTNLTNVVDAEVAKMATSLEVVRIENIAKGKDVTASSTTGTVGNVIDGTLNAVWDTTTDEKGEAWIKIDLGAKYDIERYALQLHTASGDNQKLNLKDYRVEISNDGNDWKKVDTVTDNTAAIVDRQLNNVSGRHIRLYVTAPNSSTNAEDALRLIIREWSIYGVQSTMTSTLLTPQLRSSSTGVDHALRFKYDMPATGVKYQFDDFKEKNDYTGEITADAKVTVNGEGYTLKEFGAIVSIKPNGAMTLENLDNKFTKSVPAQKLYDVAEDGTVTYTAVVTGIPAANVDTPIYSRSYMTLSDGTTEFTLYGSIAHYSVSGISDALGQ